MEVLQETRDFGKKSFFGHVFNTSEESNAEIMNICQYALLSAVPVVALNKLIQRFIPEADPDKSSIEILVEVFIQLVIMFVGIILIHRVVTYAPTYSGFKYENFHATNFVLGFLVIVLSIQTKLGMKMNILYDRVSELWNGSVSDENTKASVRSRVRVSDSVLSHMPSQADHLDNSSIQMDLFPPAPVATAKPNNGSYDSMMRGPPAPMIPQPMAANSGLGGGFGRFV